MANMGCRRIPLRRAVGYCEISGLDPVLRGQPCGSVGQPPGLRDHGLAIARGDGLSEYPDELYNSFREVSLKSLFPSEMTNFLQGILEDQYHTVACSVSILFCKEEFGLTTVPDYPAEELL